MRSRTTSDTLALNIKLSWKINQLNVFNLLSKSTKILSEKQDSKHKPSGTGA